MTREMALEKLINLKKQRGRFSINEHTALNMAIKALEQEPCKDAISRQAYDKGFDDGLEEGLKVGACDDCISRQDAIDLADELKDDLPDDDHLSDMVMSHNEGILEYQTKLSLLPPVTPAEKVGRWISFGTQGEIDGQIVRAFTCSKCGAISIFRMASGNIVNGDLCPNCGAKMKEVEE